MRRFVVILVGVLACVLVAGALGARLIPQPQREYLSALTEEIAGPNLLSSALLGDSDEGGSAEQEESLPPAPDPRITTVLVVGSDARTGAGNTAYGSAEGQRSDSTMIVQVNPYIKRTTVVSIPRDLWVRLPECAGGGQNKFNAAFSLGGLNCTVRLVRQLTGLHLDHVAVLDFNAFKQAVDTLGGVDVCVNSRIKDPLSGLRLRAGVTRLDGESALAFARSRHSTATGSDLSRIERQQYLLLRLASEASRTARDPMTVYRLLSAVQPYLTVDDGFDTWSMAYLGLDAVGSDIVTGTLPWKITRSVPWGSVALDRPAAAKVLRELADPPRSLSATAPAPASAQAPSAPSAPSASATAAPSPPATTPPAPRIPCTD